MLFRAFTLLLAIVSIGAADILTLRSGEVVRGEYLGGDARHVKMAVGDRVENYLVEDVAELRFGRGEQGSHSAPPPPPPDTGFATDQRQAQQPVYGLQLSVGTPITVRMIDGVDSEETRLGQTFRASIDEPVMVGDQVAIPRGNDVVVKLVEDRQSGKFAGKTVLTLVIQQIMVNGRMVDVTTGDVSQASGSRGARTGKVVGGTTALGAIIGAIAGGGKGAAIGAASGAGVGAAAQIATKGQRVKIPSETRLTFSLQQPVTL